ncbi:MAG: hypothetical protein AB7N76_16425 [Planctomycetota bacterium]
MLDRLGWLRGFPAAATSAEGAADPHPLAWFVVAPHAPPERVVLDRGRLREARFALRSLRRRFPRALADVVGDVDAWQARVERRLDRVAAVLHEGAGWPGTDVLLAAAPKDVRGRARRLSALSGLRGLIAALVWTWGDEDPARLADALGRCERWQTSLGELLSRAPERGLDLALRASAADDPEAWEPLLHYLGEVESWEVPLGGAELARGLASSLSGKARRRDSGYVARLLRAARRGHAGAEEDGARGAAGRAGEPSEGPGDHARRLLGEALRVDEAGTRGERARGLRLLAALLPRGRRDAWRAWWRGLQALCAVHAERLRGSPPERAWHEAAGTLQTHAQRHPARVPALPLEALRRAAAPERAESFPLLLELVEQAGEEPFAWDEAGPLHEAGSCGCPGSEGEEGAQRAPRDREEDPARRLLVAVDRELGALPGARAVAALRCLRAAAQRGGRGALSARYLDTLLPFLAESLGRDCEPPGLAKAAEEGLAELLAELAEAGSDTTWDQLEAARSALRNLGPAAAAALGRALGGCWLEREVRDRIVDLAAAAPTRASELADLLGGGAGRAGWLEASRRGLARLAERAELRPLLLTLLLARGRETRRLADLAGPLPDAAELLPGAEPAAPPWIASYPEELRPGLGLLAALEPERAEEVARRALRRDLPTRAELGRELRAIDHLLASDAASGARRAGLARRRAALRARLSAEVSARPSPARLERLRRRVEERAEMAWLELATARLQARLRAQERELALVSALGHADLLPALAQLPAAARTTLSLVLGARGGPQPWDLREHPRNRAFLERLLERGVDVVPWLEGFGELERSAPGASDPSSGGARPAFRLSLEEDPLEVLRMGEAFQTCLAPGSFNFWSAVSNAADINKRVLYGRDAAGKVVGRVLLAITEETTLRAFRPYALAPTDGFAAAAELAISELAAAMGIARSSSGRVVTLVARDWYDDGERAEAQQDWPPLVEGAPLRAAAARLDPAAWLRRLRHELGLGESDPLPARLGQALLRLPELAERVPLLIALGRELVPDTWTRLELARRLRTQGEVDAATELALGLLRAPRADACPCCQCRSCVGASVAEELLACGRPQQALRALRSTRERVPRRRGREEPRRADLEARALWALHRQRRAVALLRSARPGASEEALRRELAAG